MKCQNAILNSRICLHYSFWHVVQIVQVVVAIIPVCTLSPTCRSDIAIDIPVSSVTVAVAGKQESTVPIIGSDNLHFLHFGAPECHQCFLLNS